ncbi:hypothetical protein F5884DRAFT_689226 [Xylogone sp. PMI_703]|nr:hypothetical protein F5884DRAFT_689226 [Xylogone sp. PMI_703]
MDPEDETTEYLLDHERVEPKHNRHTRIITARERWCWILAVIGLCTIFTLWITGNSDFELASRKRAGPKRNPCGNNPAEAAARGCEFDVLSFCWLPQECLDHELTEEFRKAGPWTYYGDDNKTTIVSEAEFGQDTQKVWLTNELHSAHCAFSWLKFHKAIANGEMIHDQFALKHTHHCSEVLRYKGDPQEIRVHAIIQYPDCGYFTDTFPGIDFPHKKATIN